MNEEEVFHQALAHSPAERAAFLQRACAGDPALQASVEALLRANVGATGFLEQPAVGLDAPFAGEGPAERALPRTVEEQPIPEGPGTVIGPYKLLQQIGEGGMGTVFMAQQTQPVQRKVALKIIKPGLGSRQVSARFEAERQALALMDHPNIARVIDAGTTGSGRPYFVMELVKGIPITRYCDEHQLTPKQRLELFLPVCHAIQHAHQKGIIHRDLKPSNVLVAEYDDQPVPKVIDFGVAKATGPKLTEQTLFTEFGQVVGTLEYMSPEQAKLNALDVDTRSDIYVLGVVLYELLTGTTPFDRKRLSQAAFDEMLRIIREEEPPKPSTRLSESKDSLPSISALRQTEPTKLTSLVKGELDWIVMKALEKDRNRRYDTANGFAMHIQRYLADEPVLACPPSTGYRLRKFVRRNKAPVLTAALVLLVLVAGIIGTTWGLLRARQARAAAVTEAMARTQAEATAQHDRDLAIAAEADTKAFSNVLVDDVLASARPKGEAGGLGKDVTVRAALDAAATRLAETFRNRPCAEAAARDALGVTYRLISELPKAERHLRRAVELRRQALGIRHPDTLTSQDHLGVTLVALGRHGEARTLLAKTFEDRTAELGADHPDTLSSREHLAEACMDAGRFADAVALYEEGLKLWRARHGLGHAGTACCMCNLAVAYQRVGRVAESVPLLEEGLRLLQARYGPEHPDTLNARSDLADAYLAVNRAVEAVPLFESVVQIKTAKLGPDHLDTLRSADGLASAYMKAGRTAEGLALYEETLRRRRAKLGPNHPDTLTSLNNLAVGYRAAGRLAEAIPLFEDALKLTKARQGPNHPHTIQSQSNLAIAYRDAGRSVEAAPLLEEALRLQTTKYGPDDPDAIGYAIGLATVYDQLKNAARAEPLYRDALARQRRRLPSDSPVLATTLFLLGRNLLRQRKAADAEPVLRECLGIRVRMQPEAWLTFRTRSVLGGGLVLRQKYAEAEPLLLAGYDGLWRRRNRLPAYAKKCPAQALGRLVTLYNAWGKPERAAEWRRKLDAQRERTKK